MADEFSAPSSASGIKWDELKGSLLLITVNEFRPEVRTMHGDQPAVSADVVALDGDAEGATYADTLVFPKVLISQLKARAGGGKVLGRLGKGTAKPGQSAPWMLSEATEDDKTKARAYISKTTVEAPF